MNGLRVRAAFMAHQGSIDGCLAPGVQRLVSITCRGGNLLRLSAVLLVAVIGVPVTVFIFFEHDAKILEVHHDLAVEQDLNIGLGPGLGVSPISVTSIR